MCREILADRSIGKRAPGRVNLFPGISPEKVSGEMLIRLHSPASEEAISRAASLVVHFGKHGIPVSFEGHGISVDAGTGSRFIRKLLTMLALWDGLKSEASSIARSRGTTKEPNLSGESSFENPGEAHARFG
jgi:uncharacterized protein (DUF58 family)